MRRGSVDTSDSKAVLTVDSDARLDAAHTDDVTYLQQLGYKPELKRLLGGFSSFALQFTMIAVSGGIFLTFGLGLTTFGPAFFWAWVVGGGLQMIVGMSIAGLVSAYPVAGGAYQIINRIANPQIAWQVGWWLIMAHIAALSGEAVGLAPFVASWFGIASLDTPSLLLWTFGLLALVTVVNLLGVRFASLTNNIGVIAELVAFSTVIVVIAFATHHFQPVSFLTSTAGTVSNGNWIMPFLFAMLVPAFVISGFDANGTAGEETKNASRAVPKGMVLANWSSYFYGTLGIGLVLLAAGNISGAMKDAFPMMFILKGSVGNGVAQFFQVAAVVSLLVNMEILELTAARVIFSQARDGQMPAAGFMRRLNRQQIPMAATLVTVVVAVIMTLWAPILAVLVAMTALAWAAGYTVTIGAGIRAKRRNALPTRQWTYGRWGLVVDVVAIVWSFVLCAILIIQNPGQVGVGFAAVVVAGLLIYYFLIPRSRRGKIPGRVQDAAPAATPELLRR
jgi:amino acid transporter